MGVDLAKREEFVVLVYRTLEEVDFAICGERDRFRPRLPIRRTRNVPGR
jgi:hypothetical protein